VSHASPTIIRLGFANVVGYWPAISNGRRSDSSKGLGFVWLCGTVVERRSVISELSLSCARPAADGWPLIWV